MVPVVLSGGSGTRLWPYSRSLYPKQFLPLTSELTMVQETVLRLDGLSVGAPWVICNEDHRFMVAEQLRSEGATPAGIILEPVGRNTAPAIALAALALKAKSDDSVMLVLPADHVIENVAAFHESVLIAKEQAESGKLVTFGIVPTAPETGYGYIKRSNEYAEGVFGVDQFVEKPDLATAEDYVSSGQYYWNSGMFMFRPSRYLEELERFSPEMLSACRAALDGAACDLDFTRVDKAAFEACPEDSIDYAVMEKTDAAVVVPMDAQWSDVGSWSALWEVSDKDENGNTCKGDVITHDSENCYIQADKKLIATVGIQDMVVVDTDDSVLIASKDRVQEVKKIVSSLKQSNRSEASLHRKVYRPWGYYDSIDAGERFQVKRIVVHPGAELSLQMHHHRAEHWIVVSGTAVVVNGEKEIMLTENQSTYIPIGQKHQLKNPGSIPLELIEVQSGSYLGEDDIVRFSDLYGRA
ncbi:mannose-1-phosphate guanylyltransferase/mannose-6-phosphate isomerase [Marinibactrum halimedae]|uniref:mannose-1-phosphate guanylyltransferase n=1 Tax=Marinibactrum halimedae TaxID=1444977 RepID=A0AA37T2P8_9GAMM|nr:mannose-1-phosphate guanylyltransferase/mannose-6-phosphate isomerase [Marinibactrum halimedae]MCD9460452.1 mannose-1-phosphate guanylyltransferase/mannose-6-phosphate isomerase [Marinibactrum halimedae]GLS25859.1 xanthan biosynthesis protein XanB [Marinibactrum halimedae]